MHVPSPHLQHLAETPAALEFAASTASTCAATCANSKSPANAAKAKCPGPIKPAPTTATATATATPKTDAPPESPPTSRPRAQKLEETLSRLAEPETGQLGYDLVVHHDQSVNVDEAPHDAMAPPDAANLAVVEVEQTVGAAAELPPQRIPVAEPRAATADEPATADESINEHAEPNPNEFVAKESAAPNLTSFQAEWEVDHFRWPEETTSLAEIIEQQAENLSRDGQLKDWVAVSGATQRAGASTLTLSLARHIARRGSRVVVVDANFDNPQLAEMLGMQVQDGWEKALAGEANLDQIAIVSLEDGVVLLPLRKTSDATATNANLVAAQRLVALRENFDVILIDVGTGTENLAAVATTQDETLPITTLIITDTRQRQASATQETITHLRLAGIDAIHLVENFASA